MSRSLGGPNIAMRSRIEPITPALAETEKNHLIPEEVIIVINDLITENLSGGIAVVKQKTIVSRLVDEYNFSESEIFNKHMLDVEKIYRNAGWVVEYDKPAYCESYDAYFKFKRK